MSSEVWATAEIIDEHGLDYALQVGTNRDGRKVIWVGMRETGRRASYKPVIEMDVDISSLYKDIDSDISIEPSSKDEPMRSD